MSLMQAVTLTRGSWLTLLLIVGVPRTMLSQRKACDSNASWRPLVEAHVKRYPALEIEDVFKLLLHATLGAEHAAPSFPMAQRWLDDELRTMGSGPRELLVDTLGPQGRYARIHLRPFQQRGGNATKLARAFAQTPSDEPADTAAFHCALSQLRKMAAEHRLPWPLAAVSAYMRGRARERWPAVHHSAAFEAAYRPAYRVIAVSLVQAVVP